MVHPSHTEGHLTDGWAGLDVLRKLATVPAASKTEGTPCVPFLMDRESRLQPTEFEIDFIQGKDVFRYTVKADRYCVLYERLRSLSRRRIDLDGQFEELGI